MLVVEARELQLRQARELAVGARLARGEHDRRGLRQQPPGDEPQDLARRAVEPLGVVDAGQQRLALGDLGEQRHSAEGDEEAVGRVTGGEAERHAQGALLGLWQAVELPEQRGAELMQPGERQLHLGLDAGDPGDAEPRRLLDGVAQQRRLADPRISADDEDRAAAVAGVVQQPPDGLAFAQPVLKLPLVVGSHRDTRRYRVR